MENVTFIDLTAIGNSGSAFCIFETDVQFSGVTSISKNSGRFGGGIMITSHNSVSFLGHTAVSGGAIYSFYETILTFGRDIKFEQNIADEDAWAICALGTTLTFKQQTNVTFTFNSAQIGGAMYLNGAAFLILVTLNTSHNCAFKYGGVLYHTIPVQCEFDPEGSTDQEWIKLPQCFLKLSLNMNDIGNTIHL